MAKNKKRTKSKARNTRANQIQLTHNSATHKFTAEITLLPGWSVKQPQLLLNGSTFALMEPDGTTAGGNLLYKHTPQMPPCPPGNYTTTAIFSYQASDMHISNSYSHS